MSVDVGSVETNVEPSSDWSIDPIQNLAHNEPQECRPNVAINNGLQRN